MLISDPNQVFAIVFRVIIVWVAKQTNLSPSKVNVSRKFLGPPMGGYSFTRGTYWTMCDQIAPSISVATGHALTLSQKWRTDHEVSTISQFIADVSDLTGRGRPIGTVALANRAIEARG